MGLRNIYPLVRGFLEKPKAKYESLCSKWTISYHCGDGVNITYAEAIWILGTFRTSIIVNN